MRSSSLTRDQTQPRPNPPHPHWELRVLTTGHPGKSLCSVLDASVLIRIPWIVNIERHFRLAQGIREDLLKVPLWGQRHSGFWLDWNQRLKGYQDLLPSSFLCSSFLQLGFPQTTVNILQLLQFASVSFSKKAVVFLLHAKFKNPREELQLGQFTPAAHSCTNQLCSVG